MNYMTAYNNAADKLAALLDEHSLVHTFKTHRYPLTLIISPNASPEAQMSVFETKDESVTASDAKLIFTFPVDEIGIKTYGRLVMSDSLMSKVKGLAKKMHKAYCEGAVACAIEAGTAPQGFNDEDEDEFDDAPEDTEADLDANDIEDEEPDENAGDPFAGFYDGEDPCDEPQE